MIKLSDLYPEINIDIIVRGIKSNPDNVTEGDLYVCTINTYESQLYVDKAVKNGASAVVVSTSAKNSQVPTIRVPNSNKEFPYLCQKFYGFPDLKMKTIAITGTDGKSTVGKIIQTLIGSSTCGFVDTEMYSCAGFEGKLNNQFLRSNEWYKTLKKLSGSGCGYVALETDSESFLRGQLQATKFDISIFTNITSEHLDVHNSLEGYIQSKLRLFMQTKKEGYCILNSDDTVYTTIKAVCGCQVLSYGKKEGNTLQIVEYNLYPNKTKVTFKYKDDIISIESPLLGETNVYNLAAAILACLLLGFKIDDLIKNISTLKNIKTMHLLNTNTPYSVFIDYAHSLNSIMKTFEFIKKLDIKNIFVVVGDVNANTNKTLIERTICSYAKHAIFSYGYIKEEDLNEISGETRGEFNNFELIKDKRKAIRSAIQMAENADVVLLLDRYGENKLLIDNKIIYCNDEEEAYQAIALKNK